MREVGQLSQRGSYRSCVLVYLLCFTSVLVRRYLELLWALNTHWRWPYVSVVLDHWPRWCFFVLRVCWYWITKMGLNFLTLCILLAIVALYRCPYIWNIWLCFARNSLQISSVISKWCFLSTTCIICSNIRLHYNDWSVVCSFICVFII